ncbi:hypothetical protein AGDE_03265 [Angomonas deanei]|nr:hypothetical protein AGDE_03265 [Angomonas deanei]|eukprot:EPY40662.1 hypothetical protein AGDE_03265 [Angomonas deanei]
MLDENRFCDVVTFCRVDAWKTAASVSSNYPNRFYVLMKEKLVLLYNILPYVNEEFLSTMGSTSSHN